MPRFGTVMTAMVTPFADDGTVDFDGAAKLAKYLVANGNDGLVVAGTTGESATLTHDEHIALVEVIANSVDVPVIAGTGSNDTAAAVELTQRASAAGCDAILSVTPYYNRPSQNGLLSHFRAVAECTDLPVMLYDVPHRTGRKIGTETILSLAHQVDNVVALKDAAQSPAETARVVAEAPDDFEVYGGDDPLTLAFLAVGAVGTISIAAHWAGVEIGEMMAAYQRGDVADAARLNGNLISSYDFCGSDEAPSPVPSKAMMRVLGLSVGQCRLPMGPEPDGLEDRAKAVLSHLGRHAR